ncbi:hypothetical protein DEJ61_12715 [Bacilli bacterium]|nr:hypothetical protein DEJ61_12715 [Bacilli bacterium]
MFYKTDYTLMNNKGKRKSLGAVAQPKFISPLSLGYALHTLEEGDFFRKCVKSLDPFFHFFRIFQTE